MKMCNDKFDGKQRRMNTEHMSRSNMHTYRRTLGETLSCSRQRSRTCPRAHTELHPAPFRNLSDDLLSFVMKCNACKPTATDEARHVEVATVDDERFLLADVVALGAVVYNWIKLSTL